MTGNELIKALETFRDKKIYIKEIYFGRFTEAFYKDVKEVKIEGRYVCINT